eukprot:403374927
MSIILEQFKLEIITLLPKILQIARKSLTKKKQSLIEKTKQQIIKTINKVRLEVIEEYGELVGCKNEEEFFSKLDKLRVSQDVQKIDDQIIGAIEMALQGQEPDLKVELEDEKLDCECYKQIVSKLYSVIRFKLYQNIKQKLRLSANSGNLTENDLRECVKDLDIETVRKEVFQLYEIDIGLDTQLSLRKIQYLYQDDEMFQNYLKCLKEAHDRFLTYLFQGYKFKKMEQNPLHSKDLNYGIPNRYNQILDELLDDTHQILAEEYQQNQIRRFSNSVSPRAKVFKNQLATPKRQLTGNGITLPDTQSQANNDQQSQADNLDDGGELFDKIIRLQRLPEEDSQPRTKSTKVPNSYSQMKKKNLFIQDDADTIEHLQDSDSFQVNQDFDNNNLRQTQGSSTSVLIQGYSSQDIATPQNRFQNRPTSNTNLYGSQLRLTDSLLKLSPDAFLTTRSNNQGFFQNDRFFLKNMAEGNDEEYEEDDDDMMLVQNVDINEIQDRKAMGYGRGHSDYEDDSMYVKPQSL